MGQQQIKISIDAYMVTIELVNNRYSTDQKSLQISAQNIDADIQQENLQANYSYEELPEDIKLEFKTIQKLFQHLSNITGTNSSCCMRDTNIRKVIKIQKKQLCFDKKGYEFKLKLNVIQSNHSGSIFDEKLKSNQKNSKISIQERLEEELKKQKQIKTEKVNNNTNNVMSSKTNLVMTNDQISYQTLNDNKSKKSALLQTNNFFKYFICCRSNQKLLNLRQKNPILKQFLLKRISNQKSLEKQNTLSSFINGIDTKIITSLDLFDNQLKNEDFYFIFQSINKNSFDSQDSSKQENDWIELKKLWIDKNKISIIKDNFLNYFSKQLQVFSLSQNNLNNAAISKIFCNRFKWPKLNILKISFISEEVQSCLKTIVDYLISLGTYCMPQLQRMVITQVPQQKIESQSIVLLLQKLKHYGSIQKIRIQSGIIEKQNLISSNEANFVKVKFKTIVIQFKKVEGLNMNENNLDKLGYPQMYQDERK